MEKNGNMKAGGKEIFQLEKIAKALANQIIKE